MERFLNKITLGDCYELIKQLPDKSVDCIYTDIPYLYDSGGLSSTSPLDARIAKKRQELKFISNGIDYSILDEFKRVLKKVNIFIWCSKAQLLEIMQWGVEYNFELLVWCKTNPQPSTFNNWLPDVEYCLYFREKGVPLNDGYELKSKWHTSAINKNDKDMFMHPTIKPLQLVIRHLEHTTQSNDIVLDCFAGSGTTCVAAQETGRQFIGFEIEEKYWKIANDRLNKTDANGQMSLFLR